jgi:hypothetical protein
MSAPQSKAERLKERLEMLQAALNIEQRRKSLGISSRTQCRRYQATGVFGRGRTKIHGV